MNKIEFEEWLEKLAEEDDDYIYNLIEESKELENNDYYDGDWTNYIDGIYRYNKGDINIVFRYSYSESSSGNCCDKWDKNIELLENYDTELDSKLDEKVDIIYDKIETMLNAKLPLTDDYIYLKDVIKEALKEIESEDK
jgi:mRNA-degrading endonuclease RelE of RelBE toxin-antitoxin system